MGINFGNVAGMGIKLEASWEMGLGIGNELMGMGGNGNVASQPRTSLSCMFCHGGTTAENNVNDDV